MRAKHEIATRTGVLSLSTFPVIEIFGPTLQGEGPLVGTPVAFVRLGGCDYRCAWCDSMHAVLPEEVRANAVAMSSSDIVDQLQNLSFLPQWIVISGGNPVLHDLSPLVSALTQLHRYVAVETQGTLYKEWLRECHSIAVSPKPPSSRMVTNWKKLDHFFDYLLDHRELDNWPTPHSQPRVFLKVVVFDDADLCFAEDVRARYPRVPLYLLLGTDVGMSARDDLLDRLRDFLIPEAFKRPVLRDAIISCQQHVLLWGHLKGV